MRRKHEHIAPWLTFFSLVVCLLIAFSFPMFAQGPTNWKDRYVTLSPDDDYAPQIARPDTGAYVIVVWEQHNSNGYDIMAQKIETTHGLPLWSGDGVPVCTSSGDQRNPRAAYDQGGGVIVTWEDHRGSYTEIYAHRILVSNGHFDTNWSSNADGVPVCTGINCNMSRPRIVGTGDGAFIAWTDPRSGKNDVYAQYLSGFSGAKNWQNNGIRVNQYHDSTLAQQNPELVLDLPPQQGATPGIVVVWEDTRCDAWQIYAQLIDYRGAAQWGSNDVAVAPTQPCANQRYPQIARDLSVVNSTPPGPVIVWVDDRNGSGHNDIYAQQLDFNGNRQWSSTSGDGLEVCLADSAQGSPRLAYYNNKAIVAWEDNRNAGFPDHDIYAAMIDVQNGNVMTSSPWQTDGRSICTYTGDQKHIALNMDASWAVIGWQDNRGADWDIYVQKIESDGAYGLFYQSDGWPVTEAKNAQELPEVSGSVFVYQDTRRADFNIYAQKLGGESDGYTAMSYRDMFAKWAFASPAGNHKMVTDSSGSVYVAWQETRGTGVTITSKIFVQKFDSTGVPLWTNDGVLVSNPAYNASDPDISCGGTNGVFVIFLQNGDVILKDVGASTITVTDSIAHGSDTFTEPKVVDNNNKAAILVYILNGTDVVFHRTNPSNTGTVKSTYAQGLIVRKDRREGCYAIWKSGSATCDVGGFDRGGGNNALSTYTFSPSGTIQKYDLATDLFLDGNSNYGIFVVCSAVNGSLNDIFFKRLTSNGSGVFSAASSVNITGNGTDNSYSPKVTCDGLNPGGNNGGAVVVWHTVNSGTGYAKVETQRVMDNNSVRWSPQLSVSSGNWWAHKPEIDRVSDRYSMAVWEDSRPTGRNSSGMWTLRGQLIDPTGTNSSTTFGWASNGVVVSEPAGGSEQKPIVRNSFNEWVKQLGSATIFWQDERSDTASFIGTRKIPDGQGTLKKSGNETARTRDLPTFLSLDQNHPNPFGGVSLAGSRVTRIGFALNADAHVTLKVYDVFGREVSCIVDAGLPKGRHDRLFDAGTLPSGTYLYRLTANKQVVTRKMVLLK